ALFLTIGVCRASLPHVPPADDQPELVRGLAGRDGQSGCDVRLWQLPPWRGSGVLWPLLAGAVWGFAALTRGEFFYIGIAAAAAVFLILRGGLPAAKTAIAIIAGVALAVTPYCIRNALVFHAPFPISDDSAYSLWEQWGKSPQSIFGKQFFSWP